MNSEYENGRFDLILDFETFIGKNGNDISLNLFSKISNFLWECRTKYRVKTTSDEYDFYNKNEAIEKYNSLGEVDKELCKVIIKGNKDYKYNKEELITDYSTIDKLDDLIYEE